LEYRIKDVTLRHDINPGGQIWLLATTEKNAKTACPHAGKLHEFTTEVN
jgi:hypothetical protein